MTYAGVLLAFSVPVTPAMLEANDDVPEAGRAIVVPVLDPFSVRTHAKDGEGSFLVAGDRASSFPAGTQDPSLRRALAYVEPRNGTYEPAQISVDGVASRNGTSPFTLDVAALAGGASGWIVMGSNEEAPSFVARSAVVGEVARFTSGAGLAAAFALGFVGFIAPLVALVATHRPRGQRGPPVHVCRECGAAFPSNSDFCLRCGAYRGERADA